MTVVGFCDRLGIPRATWYRWKAAGSSYRHDIGDGVDLAAHADSFRTIYNSIRPHETIAMARPLERYRQTVSGQQEMPAGGQQWLLSHGHLVTLRRESRDGRAC